MIDEENGGDYRLVIDQLRYTITHDRDNEAEILRLKGILGNAVDKTVGKLLRSWARNFEKAKGRCPAGYEKCPHCGKVFSSLGLISHVQSCHKNQEHVNPRMPSAGISSSGRSKAGTGKGGKNNDLSFGIASSNYRNSVDYTTHIDLAGTYIVVNGEPIFLKHGHDTRDGRIVRSDSSSEDYWRGFGVGRPDNNGRFGSIIGEDYSD